MCFEPGATGVTWPDNLHVLNGYVALQHAASSVDEM